MGNYKYITFIIGSSHGLDKKIKGESDRLVSFSKMTFTHQVMQYILLEQICRSYKVIKNEKYHKYLLFNWLVTASMKTFSWTMLF